MDARTAQRGECGGYIGELGRRLVNDGDHVRGLDALARAEEGLVRIRTLLHVPRQDA